MCDYLACPSSISIIAFLLTLLGIASIIIFWKTKKIFISIFIFSFLSNIILYEIINYRFTVLYGGVWIFKFTRYIWPWLNLLLFILLIINFLKNKYAKTKNN
ncbi:MAG: hypothetical protein A2288_00135 [Candidatus Moranbacteria bacterium RIFOXYA12_FULL_44_15]|nr:MAG: hypothetical protein A2288_00135 [Candidatus Moranbacteria bacterium RIFOXYA12_FULL_44_15]OGI36383.1 MAG: hypothetical protein A2259_00655 [Candidatus Moranbacteria bacterium RIFOXYA2_FULL_43_15]